MKNAFRAVLVLAFLFTAQLGYGLSFDGLLGVSTSHVGPLPEPASLVALGLGMLLFARVARRKPVTVRIEAVVDSAVAPQNSLLREPRSFAA